MEERTCKKCNKSKTIDLFPKNGISRGRSFKYHSCYKCLAKAKVETKQDCRTPKGRFGRSQRCAKRRNLEWTISFEDFCLLIVLPCHYCGATTIHNGSGLDRIDNSKGYTLENVIPCCPPHNYLRHKSLSVAQTEMAVLALMAFDELAGI